MTEQMPSEPTSVDPWRAGAPAVPDAGESTSPYRRTAFDVLDVGIEPMPRPQFLARVRRRVTRAGAGLVRAGGAPVGEAEVRVAQRQLETPADRVAQRLVAHQPHPVQLHVSDLAGQLAGRPAAPAGGPLLDRARLAALLDVDAGGGDG